jgi:hypothetical protein
VYRGGGLVWADVLCQSDACRVDEYSRELVKITSIILGSFHVI